MTVIIFERIPNQLDKDNITPYDRKNKKQHSIRKNSMSFCFINAIQHIIQGFSTRPRGQPHVFMTVKNAVGDVLLPLTL